MNRTTWLVFFIFFVILTVTYWLVFFPSVPMINDITTTPDDPPRYHFVAEDPQYEKWMAEKQHKAYPDIVPKVTTLPASELFWRVRALAEKQEGWTVEHEDQSALSIEAVATTPWLHFKDDVVIQVRPEGSGSAVHMRSRSRLGKGDMGTNAARIHKFLDELDVQPKK